MKRRKWVKNEAGQALETLQIQIGTLFIVDYPSSSGVNRHTRGFSGAVDNIRNGNLSIVNDLHRRCRLDRRNDSMGEELC
jgi:hypothetical protein